MGVYPGSGKGRPYVQRGGGVLYFLAPKCLRRGYKL
jgi:ribosomal protein L24E